MKCPKCGYNSFEFYDICKKCSSDMVSYKQTYSIAPLILPLEAKEGLAAELRKAEGMTEQFKETMESHDDIFSFDLPGEAPIVSGKNTDDPFNFIEHSAEVSQSRGVKSDDVFADLLESSIQSEVSPFAPPQATAAKPVAAAPSLGEFDLESFSWDDTPTAASASDRDETPDGFDSLFGDAQESTSKKSH